MLCHTQQVHRWRNVKGIVKVTSAVGELGVGLLVEGVPSITTRKFTLAFVFSG